MSSILLIEDNLFIQDMMRERLKLNGYQVTVAGNGAEGIEKAASGQPALILMDLTLPVLDGRQAARQLRSQPETQAIPIILLTGHANLPEQEPALMEWFDDFEIKPINFERLIEKI